MSRKKLIILIYVVFAAALAAYWLVFALSPDAHYRWVQGEDRAVEWVTFAGFLGACVAAVSLLRMRKAMRRRDVCYFLLLGFFFFVCAGEEISWGQRLLGFETPDSISIVNEQKEFNIHNLDMEHFHPKDIVSWFMKSYGIILPLVLLYWMRKPNSTLHRYLSPPALIPCFLFPELINALEPVFDGVIRSRLGEKAVALLGQPTEEVVEMYWGLCVLAAMLVVRDAWKARSTDEAL